MRGTRPFRAACHSLFLRWHGQSERCPVTGAARPETMLKRGARSLRPDTCRVSPVPYPYMSFHSGFVCILGRPNAGKSTLLNALVGEKLAIISPKPQTTRNRIQGIVNVPKSKGQAGAQLVLIDTPGVHKPDSSLGRKMMVEVREALEGCDVVLLIMDATRKLDRRDEFAIQMLKHSSTKVCLILNKVDLLRGGKGKLLPLIEEYKKLHPFHEIIPISALKRDGLDILLKQVTAALPAGPPLFPEDHVTDQPARFMAGEIVRERVLVETEG